MFSFNFPSGWQNFMSTCTQHLKVWVTSDILSWHLNEIKHFDKWCLVVVYNFQNAFHILWKKIKVKKALRVYFKTQFPLFVSYCSLRSCFWVILLFPMFLFPYECRHLSIVSSFRHFSYNINSFTVTNIYKFSHGSNSKVIQKFEQGRTNSRFDWYQFRLHQN